MEVRSKTEMYRLLEAGRFGNRVRTWASVDEVEASGFTGLVSLRSKQRSNPVCKYHIPADQLRAEIDALPDGLARHGLAFCESPPDHLRTIQGELMVDAYGLYLHYSYSPKPMRFALREDGHEARGLVAKTLLEYWLEPVDVDWLRTLLADYPDAVIEFTGFRVPVGVIPHSKMLVWEVRNY